MSGDKGGSKADTLVKVVLFFFISLLSFSVGTFVGKQVSDSDHRRMALEGEYSGRQVAAVDDAHDADEKITEKEVDALTEEFVNREKAGGREPASGHDGHADHAEHKDATIKDTGHHVASTDGYKAYPRGKDKKDEKPIRAEKVEASAIEPATHAADASKKAITKATKTVTDGAHAAAEKVAEGKAPTDGAKEEKKAVAGLPSVASSAVGKYTVQVGSYLEENEAKNRAADLKGKGWNAFYLPATVKGKTWYRVLVGLFNNQDSAKQFRAQFMKEANTQSAIVQKIVQ